MFCCLFALWVILNGKVTIEICVLGTGISAVLFAFMCRFMDYSWRREFFFLRILPRLIRYLWVLMMEIVKANVAVLELILDPGKQEEPALVYFDTHLNSESAKALLANSITLTPGTITVEMEELERRWWEQDEEFEYVRATLKKC